VAGGNHQSGHFFLGHIRTPFSDASGTRDDRAGETDGRRAGRWTDPIKCAARPLSGLQIRGGWRMMPAHYRPKNPYAGTPMRKSIAVVVVPVLLWACASLPTYTAPFADVDSNGDGVVEWREFKTFYPDADAKAFLEADQNKDGEITPDEWESFVASQSS
jgi:hypothetical protein